MPGIGSRRFPPFFTLPRTFRGPQSEHRHALYWQPKVLFSLRVASPGFRPMSQFHVNQIATHLKETYGDPQWDDALDDENNLSRLLARCWV